MTAYDVDLDGLRAAVADLAACQREVVALAGDVDQAHALLQRDWTGRASDAECATHASWRQGCAEMVTALAGLRRVVADADRHYSAAVDANVAMWRQVSP